MEHAHQFAIALSIIACRSQLGRHLFHFFKLAARSRNQGNRVQQSDDVPPGIKELFQPDSQLQAPDRWPPGPSEHPAHHVFSDLEITVREIKKAMRWLHHMAYTYAAPGRALRQCNSVLQRIAPSLGIDLSDLPDCRALPTDGNALHLIDGVDEREGNKVRSAPIVSAQP
ncbi:hypothetical protein BO94DRAFT_548509 [Aspergillus sclerotioniger CBS 115572]|uniref:Uncharacterized protein n=1 Tax=Aspergillus sclerotioniger CBS 115572 TaxID=1450535 RepID=A0A317VYQ5_9EURO|nr:hypothetical protein BO94DRAFT_548509 [Aspergillus sclerotioniger CBS 115572]PWY79403.1 hypothetical protein BO94DRAFT_548509 [Aspergillus sclerotioniger CBS 115572]